MNQTFWDARYAGQERPFGDQPNSFLLKQQLRLKSGMTALVPGDGDGRNGVWLATRGLHVTSVDSSAVGLAGAKALARDRDVVIETIQTDLTQWDWPHERFDVVASIFVHFAPNDRQWMHRQMVRALKPGGSLIVVGFSWAQLPLSSGGPKDPAMLFSSGILKDDMRGMEVQELNETLIHLDEGNRHRGPAAVIEGVFIKPLLGS
jgi:SAM-dependent methyltransferase